MRNSLYSRPYDLLIYTNSDLLGFSDKLAYYSIINIVKEIYKNK